MIDLTGKTALITGGSSGIGLASARTLRDHGARVAIVGRSADRLAAARAELGEGVVAIAADVASLADLQRVRTDAEAGLGGIDILFANAGVALGTPIASADEATYDAIMDVNVKGVFFTVQALLPILRDGGAIVLNTSWLNQIGTPGRAVLSASKAAVRSFARTLSAELLERRIRVNAVSPGSIETPIHRGKDQSEADFRAYAERVGAQVPIGRMGRPEEIAAAVLFLASDVGDDARRNARRATRMGNDSPCANRAFGLADQDAEAPRREARYPNHGQHASAAPACCGAIVREQPPEP